MGIGRLSDLRHWRHGKVAVAAVVVAATAPTFARAAEPGEENFNKLCGACHSIGGGVRVGPDLKGVNERRSEDWLLKFIASSQAMVKSGDPVATALFAEFKSVVMPDAPYTADEIRAILGYVERAGSGTTAQPVAQVAPPKAASPEDIRRGSGLFQGTLPLANAGPPCNSCHHVQNDAVIGGGVLARELTAVFSRMGGAGVHAILGSPPFPVMEQAYRDRPLKDDEVFALVAFLQDADQHQAFQQPRDYGFKLLYSGVGSFALLMGMYGFFWRRRKRRPVNHAIFDRQIKSE